MTHENLSQSHEPAKVAERLVARIFCLLLLGHASNTLAQEPLSFKVESPVTAIAVASDQRILAATGKVLLILDRNLGFQRKISTELDSICSILPKDKYIYLAGGSPSEHGMIEIRTLNDGKLVQRKIVHKDVIHCMGWSGEDLLTCSYDSTACVLDGRSLKIKTQYKQHSQPITCISALPDSEWTLSAGLDDTIRVWSRATGQTQRVLTHHQDDVLGLEFARPQDGGTLAKMTRAVSISKDRTVRFWQPIIGRLVRFRQFDQTPSACSWIPGTDSVLVGFDEGQVVIASSQDLTFQPVFGGGGPVFSLALIDSSVAIVGTKRKLIRLKLPVPNK